MNKYVSKLIDQVGLALLHRKRSKKSHFKESTNNPSNVNIDEIENFFPLLNRPSIHFSQTRKVKGYEKGEYSYKETSTVISGRNSITSNASNGTYYVTDNRNSPIHIIIVHGWRADNLDRIKRIFLERFMEYQFNIYFVTLPYHFNRASDSAYSGELFITADLDRTTGAVIQSVHEIRELIHWLKEHSGGQIVLIGISLGGFISNLTSVVEEEIDIVISIMYSNSLSYEIWHTSIGKYIKEDFQRNDFTYAKLQEHWDLLEPSRWKPKVARENILLISGLYDQYIDKMDSDQLWEAWDQPLRLLYSCGHSGIVFLRKQIIHDVCEFILDKVEK